MMTRLLYSLAFTLGWVLIVGQITGEVLIVGLIVGFGLVLALRPPIFAIRWQRLPRQLLAVVLYVLVLFWDILLSGLYVARLVLAPKLHLKPGIIVVSTQDKVRSPIMLALSADYISLTPGELVIEVQDNHQMVVHCLDVEKSAAVAKDAQIQRLTLLERIVGRDQ